VLRCLALLVTTLSMVFPAQVAASAAPRTPAEATSAEGCQTVHAGPDTSEGDSEQSYFTLTMGPGDLQRRAILVANPQPYPCAVELEAAHGETAVNSGDTYVPAESGCAEAGCWLSGLPTTVTVPAGGRLSVGFDVAVPAGTPSGEYLGGVFVRPADPPSVPSESGHEQVAVSVAAQVAVGVAVVVPGPLRPLLTIPSVTLDVSSEVPQLRVRVQNEGNTWEHPTGGARIRLASSTRSFGVRSSTILAGDAAVLPLPVDSVARGLRHTRVVLNYGVDQQAVWEGDLDYPTPPAAPSADASAGSGGAAMHLPLWVYVAIGGLALLVVFLIVLILLLFRTRRRDREETPAADPVEEVPARSDALADPLPR
jgi:hypothetical protein